VTGRQAEQLALAFVAACAISHRDADFLIACERRWAIIAPDRPTLAELALESFDLLKQETTLHLV
jgi:hypothetical protein